MAVDFDEAYLVGGWLASALWGEKYTHESALWLTD
jgi:hypothetical protein